jgi:hypothetical protein
VYLSILIFHLKQDEQMFEKQNVENLIKTKMSLGKHKVHGVYFQNKQGACDVHPVL